MLLNEKSEKSRLEHQDRGEFDESKIGRVMSAPPQQIAEEAIETLFICGNRKGADNTSGKTLTTMLGDLDTKNPILDIPECDSDDVEQISAFDRFMQIEKLLHDFPPVNLDSLKSKIQTICGLEERSPVDINFYFAKGEDLYLEKITKLKSKTSTAIEKVRTEFNRATKTNVASVVSNLLAIHVEKVDDMKEVAAFVFEKIVNEAIFFDVYLQIIQQIHKDWICDEEKKMGKFAQTCFFGTLLSLGIKNFESSHKWFAQVDESKIVETEKSKIEDKLEEEFSKKLKKKQAALGTMSFFAGLYINNTVGPQTILKILKTLTATNTPENIVMICQVFQPLVKKFISVDKLDLVVMMTDYLKSNVKCGDLRLEVQVEKTLLGCPEALKILKSPQQGKRTNSFSSMAVEEPVAVPVVKKSDAEVLQEYIYYISSALCEITDEEEILDFGDKIFKGVDKFNNLDFFASFLAEAVSNRKASSKMIKILLAKLLPKAVKLSEALIDLKGQMGILRLDSPSSDKNYSELLCYLKAKDAITGAMFETLKTKEFIKHAGNLLKEWKEMKDDRLSKILPEDDDIKML
ncbi:hypothetical protein GINT2_001559 [Glugoides intestinalis]